MCRAIRPIIVLMSLALLVPPATGSDAPHADSASAVSRERLMEFWDTYDISSMHYGAYGVPSRIVGYFGRVDSTGSAVNAAIGFVEANRDIFRMSDPQAELKLERNETDSLGGEIVLLQQVCLGLPVVDGRLEFIFDPGGSMEVITCRYFPDVKAPVKPVIDSLSAISIASDSAAVTPSSPGIKCGLCILPHAGKFSLVWQIDRTDRKGETTTKYVDATSGAIVLRESPAKRTD